MYNDEGVIHYTAKDIQNLNLDDFTIVDIRDETEFLTEAFENAINIPLSNGFDGYDNVPKDKPVLVYCRIGALSEEVAEILNERGYEAATLDGGYFAYRALLKSDK